MRRRLGFIAYCLLATGCDRVFGLERGAVPDASVDTPDAPECIAPLVFDDRFDNADLATPGPSSTGPGFMAITNALGNGSSTEEAGGALEIRTSNNTNDAAPIQGVVTKSSAAFGPDGVTIRVDVRDADVPAWNGIMLVLKPTATGVDDPGRAIVLRVRGPFVHPFKVEVGDDDPYGDAPGMDFDQETLSDGFSLTWAVSPTAWSYVAEGLRTDGSAISDAQPFPPGKEPGGLFANGLFLGVHVQGTSPEMSQRIVHVRRVALWSGACR